MKNQIKAFTISEVLISIVIISIIIVGLSLSLSRIMDNLNNSNNDIFIFNKVNNLAQNEKLNSYNSGIIFSTGLAYDSLILYNSTGGYLVGVFSGTTNDFTLSTDKTKYSSEYLGLFKLNSNAFNTLSGYLNTNNTGAIYSIKFNDGEVFKDLVIKDFKINKISNSFLLNIEIFKNFKLDYLGSLKTSLVFPESTYIKLNINL